MASLCKRILLKQPIRKVELAYFGTDRIHPDELENVRNQALFEGKARAEEVHNAQILEFREELRSLHDDVLGSIQEQFEALKQAVADSMPKMAMTLLKKTLPGIEIDAEVIQKNIQNLVAEFGGGDEENLVALISVEDFALLCKAAGASEDAEFIKERAVRIQPSDTLAHGDCQLKTKFGLIDATIQTKMKHLEIALLGE